MNELRIDLDPNNPKHRQFRRLVIAEGDIRKARATAFLITKRIASVQDELFDPLSCATEYWVLAALHSGQRISCDSGTLCKVLLRDLSKDP